MDVCPNAIIMFVLGFIDGIIGIRIGILGGVLGLAYNLFIIVPSLAVSVRRLHDIGKSGWWLLLIFFVIIGWIWLFILTVFDSTPGENKYGLNQKEYDL